MSETQHSLHVTVWGAVNDVELIGPKDNNRNVQQYIEKHWYILFLVM